MKWNAIKRADGTYSRSGFTDLTAGPGESLEEYDDRQDNIVVTRTKDPLIQALLDIKASEETGTLKVILDLLQVKYG